MIKMNFPAYDGTPFFEYLLKTKQATKIQLNDNGLTIWFSEEFNRLSKLQKAELIKSRLALKE